MDADRAVEKPEKGFVISNFWFRYGGFRLFNFTRNFLFFGKKKRSKKNGGSFQRVRRGH